MRYTAMTVECFYQGRRLASHVRSYRRGHHTTAGAHMPPAHRAYAEWTPERIVGWAARTGEATDELVARVIASRRHPQQGYRSCLGILRLGQAYGQDRLEAAARRALAIGATSYTSLASILKNGLDREPLPERTPAQPIEHDNLRGAHYYTFNRRPY